MGIDGRLMRSMKSILGSSLVDQTTDVGGGRGVKYLDVIAGYLRHLKACAEAAAGAPIRRAVLGRPVYFVDDDPARDRKAQAALEKAAHAVGFQEEPIWGESSTGCQMDQVVRAKNPPLLGLFAERTYQGAQESSDGVVPGRGGGVHDHLSVN